MTIQLSVLIWTIICFCLLMLILNKMLFGPMLKFMDARQEKIDRAREKQKSDAQAIADAEKAQEEALVDAKRRQLALNASVAEQAKGASEASLEEARRQSEMEIAAFAKALEQESSELKTKLDAGIDSLAVTFADRLVS